MKVFVLTGEEYESSTILGVYSTLEKAEAAQRVYERRPSPEYHKFSYGCEIQPFELDDEPVML